MGGRVIHRFRALSAVAGVLTLLLLAGCASRAVEEEGPGPHRRIPLVGTLNTRDLGGYRTEDGRQVRWGKLYRSDQLSRLRDGDLGTVASLGLVAVYDLRTEHERDGEEDRLPPGVELEYLPISYPSMDPQLLMSRILRGDASEDYFEKMLGRANRNFALEHGPELAALIAALAEPGALPALFHCTYGKDRTGFAAAMILGRLGVPWETVVEDYLKSNEYLESNISGMSRVIWFASFFRISRASARQLLGVDRNYIDSAREAIIEEYGSTDAYFTAIGVTDEMIERLKDALLEPVPPDD